MIIVWKQEYTVNAVVLKIQGDTLIEHLVLPLCLEGGVLSVGNIPASFTVPAAKAPVQVED